MHRSSIKAITVSLALLLAGNAAARECLPHVRDGWIRLAPAGMPMPMLAGYGRIENVCPKALVIAAAMSRSFENVSLHQSSVDGGISRMRAVPTLPVAANDHVTLEPGGLHLMLMQPTGELKPGDSVQMLFRLTDGREFHGDFVVRAMR